MYGIAKRIEGFLWIAIGLCFLLSAAWRKRRGEKLLAAVNFVACGFSDFVEIHTGAWWRPWWLLAWTVACVLVMFGQFVVYARRDIRARRSRQSS